MLISGIPGLISRTPILSTQQISITIAAGATSNTATINGVTLANSVIFYGGITGGNTTINSSTDFASIVLTNSTTVTATRNTSDASNALIVNATVVQFYPWAIKSVQTGSITMTAATSNTATITSVTTTNSIVIFNGSTTTYTAALQTINEGTLTLTNATTVTANRTTGTNNLTINFSVLEFNSGILNSNTQAGQITINDNVTTGTATISAVTLAKTMLVWNGWLCTTGSGKKSIMPWLTLTNTTTVTATRANSGVVHSVVNFSVLEFKAADIASVNRGSIVIATSNTANTATISAVNTAKCIANWLGNTCADDSSNPPALGKSTAVLSLTNSTTVTATRNTSDASNTETIGYEAIELI